MPVGENCKFNGVEFVTKLYRRKGGKNDLRVVVLAGEAHDVSDGVGERRSLLYVVYADLDLDLVFIRERNDFLKQFEPVFPEPDGMHGELDSRGL